MDGLFSSNGAALTRKVLVNWNPARMRVLALSLSLEFSLNIPEQQNGSLA